MDIKKQVKLRTIFIKYLFAFCISTPFIIILAITVTLTLPNLFGSIPSKGILPSNYAENELIKSKDKIATSKKVTPNLIPNLCKYAVYTKSGKMLSGNLSSRTAKRAWKLVQNSQSSTNFFHYYLKIPRKNEVCIVQYSLAMQFASPTLRRFLPTPELLAAIIFCFGFILEVIILGRSFSQKITKKMSSLQNSVEKIQNQDLDFSIEPSGIFEVDNILFSMDKMKEALKTSMKKQWDLEEARKTQISALAHDIKTPLTIVKGNAELLTETEENDEQKEYTNYIIESSHDMERYIKALIEISKAETGYSIHKENIDTKQYLDELLSHIKALTSIKKLEVEFSSHNLPKTFNADCNLLQRAIINAVSNAVDYSKENSTITFSVEGTLKHIDFVICDSGSGFSKEALAKAKQQFYMGHSSRGNKFHYGMGLYIANSIVKQHGGKMELSNSSITKGAEVRICIPIEK